METIGDLRHEPESNKENITMKSKEPTECPYSTSNIHITCPKSKWCGDCIVYKAVNKEKQNEQKPI